MRLNSLTLSATRPRAGGDAVPPARTAPGAASAGTLCGQPAPSCRTLLLCAVKGGVTNSRSRLVMDMAESAAEEGVPPDDADALLAMTPRELIKRAKEMGIADDKIEAADAADDRKAAFVAVIKEDVHAKEAAAMSQLKAELQASRQRSGGMGNSDPVWV